MSCGQIKLQRDIVWTAQDESSGLPLTGLFRFDTDDSFSQPAIHKGQHCLQVSNPMGAPWAYFRFLSGHGRVLKSATITVDVLCENETDIWIEYDSTDLSIMVVDDAPGAFKRSKTQRIEYPDQWTTLVFHLGDTNFLRRLNGADFRIVVSHPKGTPVFLKSVSAIPGDNPWPDGDDAKHSSKEPFDAENQITFPRLPEPRVSIVIPVYNHPEITRQCLQYLVENTADEYEVIVVDDGSTVEIDSALRNIDGHRLIRHRENRGFASACNTGAAQATGALLLFLNNDTIPIKGWLTEMINCFERNHDTGIVGSKLIYPDAQEIQHAGVEFDYHGLPYHLHQFADADYPDANIEREVAAVTGACMLICSQLYERLGGFDEQFLNGYEDIDLCLRARELGCRIFFCPSSKLLHYESATENRLNIASESANRELFLRRWGGRTP